MDQRQPGMRLGFTLQRHRCISLLPLAPLAWQRLEDFFTVEKYPVSEPLPADTAALIAHSQMLEQVSTHPIPAQMRSVTVVGHRVPQAFLDTMQDRNILVTCPRRQDACNEQDAMEICLDVLAAFGFGRLGSRPRNVLNDVLLCDCC